jgi:hypothetical protein
VSQELTLLSAVLNTYIFTSSSFDSDLQVPGFIKDFDKLKAKGIDSIVCVYGNRCLLDFLNFLVPSTTRS